MMIIIFVFWTSLLRKQQRLSVVGSLFKVLQAVLALRHFAGISLNSFPCYHLDLLTFSVRACVLFGRQRFTFLPQKCIRQHYYEEKKKRHVPRNLLRVLDYMANEKWKAELFSCENVKWKAELFSCENVKWKAELFFCENVKWKAELFFCENVNWKAELFFCENVKWKAEYSFAKM